MGYSLRRADRWTSTDRPFIQLPAGRGAAPALVAFVERQPGLRTLPAFWTNLGNAYGIDRRYSDALAAIMRAVELGFPPRLVARNIMDLGKWTGRYSDALALLRIALRDPAARPELFAATANIALLAGDATARIGIMH